MLKLKGSTGGSIGITEDKLLLINESANARDWHRLPLELDGGIQAYFEGLHEFHCLARPLSTLTKPRVEADTPTRH